MFFVCAFSPRRSSPVRVFRSHATAVVCQYRTHVLKFSIYLLYSCTVHVRPYLVTNATFPSQMRPFRHKCDRTSTAVSRIRYMYSSTAGPLEYRVPVKICRTKLCDPNNFFSSTMHPCSKTRSTKDILVLIYALEDYLTTCKLEDALLVNFQLYVGSA